MDTYLHIGGVVAVGFDPNGEYLLVISHSGRGVFSTRTWERVARDTQLAYPTAGIGIGIGPIDGLAIRVTEMDYESGHMRAISPNGRIVLECESSGIAVQAPDAGATTDGGSTSSSDWHAYGPPLAEHRIADAARRIGIPLPASLLDLYRTCNGGEGSLPQPPWNFVLWGIDAVAELRDDEHYREYFDEFVFFGSSGAGEYIGLDSDGRVFFMDPIAGEESLVILAPSFELFATMIGRKPPEG